MFVVNTVDLPKRSGGYRRRTVHTARCAYARRPRYRLDTAGVSRLERRKRTRSDDGWTRFCAYCSPERLAGLLADAT